MVEFRPADWPEKYFSGQSGPAGNSVAFLHNVVFFIDRPAWLVQQEDSRGELQKKRFNEDEEIASRNMGTRKQYSSINFPGGFIEGIS